MVPELCFYLSVIHIWRREVLNLWRIRHRSRPRHWSMSGIPQTDQIALRRRGRGQRTEENTGTSKHVGSKIMLTFSPAALTKLTPVTQRLMLF